MHPFEQTPHPDHELLRKPIKDLGLRLEGSPLERYVHQLYRELERKGLRKFRPRCYLTDEWGCPSEEPVIGIPFYLADPKLQALEKSMNDLEDEREIMMYLRHEAGHAFNYAYELYKREDWKLLFGPFRRPYKDRYRPVPFSKRFVRHIAGWYAQKHPDEDFAETFAVWLTPRSNWRKRYRGWGALHKLRYVDRIARRYADHEPLRPMGQTDITVEEMDVTIEEFYRSTTADESQAIHDLPLDTDLTDIFLKATRRRNGVRPAAQLLAERRKEITDKVTYWTGVRRPLVKTLVEHIELRVRDLGLVVEQAREAAAVVEITAYTTTLAMNYLTRGRFTAE
ncbi:MAG TPA: putative zinc-binding metallopeptidase [Gemmatimonadales bacterium]|nr:putative zinc-binding metallopeptidase [Gemmatimonadales bacterium]